MGAHRIGQAIDRESDLLPEGAWTLRWRSRRHVRHMYGIREGGLVALLHRCPIRGGASVTLLESAWTPDNEPSTDC